MNEKFCILIQISLEFVPKGLIDNKTALIQVIGDKPLPEPMLTQIYVRHVWSTFACFLLRLSAYSELLLLTWINLNPSMDK